MIETLPTSWVSAKLSDICQINPRGKSGLADDDEISFVPMAAVSEHSGTVVAAEVRPVRDVKKGYTLFQEGDVLFAKITPCMENGKAAIARDLVNQWGYGSTEFHVLRPSALVLAEWIFAIIRTPEFRRAAASSFQGAVGQQRVTASFLESFRIPVPPLSEQKRIVEILQEAEVIRRLRALAEAKAAEVIPAMFFEHFIAGKDHGFTPLAELADVASGVAIGRKAKGMSVEVPYMRVANVQAGYIDLSEVKTTSATDTEIARFALASGDVLMTEGGDFDKLGRGCLWEGQVDPCIHQNHVFRVRPFEGRLNSHFFVHFLQSARAKHYFLRCAKKTTNLASINLTQLKALPVPRISIEHQEQFETRIQIAQTCGSAEGDRFSRELESSLSARAFSGKLTADWRESNSKQLDHEARDRDDALQASRPRTIQVVAHAKSESKAFAAIVFQERTDGIHSDLNREQRFVLREIKRMVGGVDYIRYFNAEMLGNYIDKPPLRKNPQAIEGHLAVLAARGLLISVSREEQTEDTGEYLYGNAYRLPLKDKEMLLGDEQGNTIVTDTGQGIIVDKVIGDSSRLREMERLVGQLEKERMMK